MTSNRERVEARGKVRVAQSRAIAFSVIISCVAVFAATAITGCAFDAEEAFADEEGCQFSLDVAAGLGEEVTFAVERWHRASNRSRAAGGKEAHPALGLVNVSEAEFEEYQSAIAVLELQDLQMLHLELASRACAFVVSSEEISAIQKLTSELRILREEFRADCKELVGDFEVTHPSYALECSPYVD